MQKIRFLCGSVVIGLLAGCGLTSEGLVVEISEEQIQQQLNARFPVTKNYVILNVSATDPKVQLRGQDERVHIGINVQAAVPTQAVQNGTATLSGKIQYDPESGEFFLGDANLESLEVSALSGPAQEQVKEIVGIVTKQVLNRVPVYQLQEGDRVESLARLFLKKIDVGDKKLRITMGLKN